MTKICRKLRQRKNAAESNKVSYLRHFCSANKSKFLKKITKSVYYVVGYEHKK